MENSITLSNFSLTPGQANLTAKLVRLPGENGPRVMDYLDGLDSDKLLQMPPESFEMIAPPAFCMHACGYCSAAERSQQVMERIRIEGRTRVMPNTQADKVMGYVIEMVEMGVKGAVWSGGGD